MYIISNFLSSPNFFRGTTGPNGTTVKLFSAGEAYEVAKVPEQVIDQEYTATYSGDCKFDPAVQGTVYPQVDMACTITFDDKPKTTLRVITNVVNDNGGEQTANFFGGYVVDSANDTIFSFRGAPGPEGNLVSFYTLDGMFEVKAHPSVASYSIEYSNGCNSRDNPSGSLTCTITYDDKYYFDLLVLGDSYMWGTGLYETEKYHTLVEKNIRDKIKSEDISEFRKIVLAHTGAVLGGSNYKRMVQEGTIGDEKPYLDNVFRWNEIPGQDGEKLKTFLLHIFSNSKQLILDPSLLDRHTVTFEKVNNGNTIIATINFWDYLTRSYSAPHYANLVLDSTKTRVTLSTSWNLFPHLSQFPFQWTFPVTVDPNGNLNVYHMPLHGEVPTSFPTILQQVDMYQGIPENVRMILVDGCGNDLGLKNIGISSLFSERIDAFCYQDMKELLEKLVVKFKNAKIVVVGYSQGISTQTSLEEIRRELQTGWRLLYSLLDALFPRFDEAVLQLLANNMDFFYHRSAEDLRRAVIETNRDYPNYGPVYFAVPDFGPQNAIFADDPWLFEVHRKNIRNPDELPLRTNDPQFWVRGMECERSRGLIDYPTCRIAAFLHPNEKGAAAFAEAINTVVNQTSLTYVDRY